MSNCHLCLTSRAHHCNIPLHKDTPHIYPTLSLINPAMNIKMGRNDLHDENALKYYLRFPNFRQLFVLRAQHLKINYLYNLTRENGLSMSSAFTTISSKYESTEKKLWRSPIHCKFNGELDRFEGGCLPYFCWDKSFTSSENTSLV